MPGRNSQPSPEMIEHLFGGDPEQLAKREADAKKLEEIVQKMEAQVAAKEAEHFAQTPEIIFYGGPGTGKSTTMSLCFGKLKQWGYNVEMAHEFAKDLTWEGHFDKRAFQPLMAAEQMWRSERLKGKVDAVLSDTSTLLCLIYGNEEGGVTPAFTGWIRDDYKRRNTLNIYLERSPDRLYNPAGRTQTEEEASAYDSKILGMLEKYEIPLMHFTIDRHFDHVNDICKEISARIQR